MTKKESIHHAAIDLFNERGFQGTSTTSITNKAGVGTGTLFTYYKSKDDLVNALYIEVKNELAQSMHDHSYSDRKFEENLFSIWQSIILWALDNGKKFRFLNEFQNSPVITKVTKDEVSAKHSFFTEMITKAQEADLIRSESIEFLSAIMGAQFTATVNYLLNNKTKEPNVFILSAYEILWNGIKK